MFEDSIGSAMVLSMIDIAVVFAVLAFLMGVVFVTKFFVNPRKTGEAIEPPTDPGVVSIDEEPAATPSETEELLAVQMAAIAACEAPPARVPRPAAAGSGQWRRRAPRTGSKPTWR